MYFDTHAHYDDEAFNEDRFELIEAMHEAGVELIVNPGCSVETSRIAMSLAEKYPFIYFAPGIHPEELDDYSEENLKLIEEMAQHPKCVAIGEIGLDYYWDASRKELQKELFRAQIEIALRMNLPIVVHDREAHGDCMEIISEYPELRGEFHCYSGSAEMAKELLKKGWYLGFDGPLTYKNVRKTVEVMEMVPLDRFLIETDSPYLSPVPKRGKRNDSRNLQFIVEKIAELRDISPEQAAKLSLENGKRFFNIK